MSKSNGNEGDDKIREFFDIFIGAENTENEDVTDGIDRLDFTKRTIHKICQGLTEDTGRYDPQKH